jgi:predicted dehydrogenase
MNPKFSRRRFLRRSGWATAGVLAAPRLFTIRAQPSSVAAKQVSIAVMGLGRGLDHVAVLLSISQVRIAYLCDVDEQRLARGVQSVTDKQSPPPKAVKDFRRILDDPAVDALTIAAPNHWHAPATILACAAGKHVYVEKPGSHNPREGEWMVAAARKHRRMVQMGNQRRSWPGVIEMIAKLRGGIIGRVLYARCFYVGARGSIGRGKPAPVPPGLDFGLWQGPAPERPYVDNLVPYNWHWRWHWGGGELLNNGVHALDLVRWGLGVEYPARVTFNGGRYHFQDDQETPDTGVAVFDFGGCGASWDDSSCAPRSQDHLPFVAFYGEGGAVVQDGAGYKVYDLKGAEVSGGTGPANDKVHFENFIAAIRDGAKLNSEIEEAQKSTLLCHLGNIAYRTGHTLRLDPATGKILGDEAASMLWGREYQPGWEPKV